MNNEIDVQFCMNTFDQVLSIFFNAYEYNILASVGPISRSLYYFHIVITRLYGRKTHKKEIIFISTRYIVLAYIVIL